MLYSSQWPQLQQDYESKLEVFNNQNQKCMQIETPNLVRIEQLLPLQKHNILTPIAYRQCSNLKIRALLILLTFRLIFFTRFKKRNQIQLLKITKKQLMIQKILKHTHTISSFQQIESITMLINLGSIIQLANFQKIQKTYRVS